MFEGGFIVLFILAHRWVSWLVSIFFDTLCAHTHACLLMFSLSAPDSSQSHSTFFDIIEALLNFFSVNLGFQHLISARFSDIKMLIN